MPRGVDDALITAVIGLCELSEWAPRDPATKELLGDALDRIPAASVARARLVTWLDAL